MVPFDPVTRAGPAGGLRPFGKAQCKGETARDLHGVVKQKALGKERVEIHITVWHKGKVEDPYGGWDEDWELKRRVLLLMDGLAVTGGCGIKRTCMVHTRAM